MIIKVKTQKSAKKQNTLIPDLCSENDKQHRHPVLKVYK